MGYEQIYVGGLFKNGSSGYAGERLKIQYGTTYVYPVRSSGAHVSAVPNHQVGRTIPIDTRANVAFFGAFGYELDLNKLSDEELSQVKRQIVFYKKNRRLFQFGRFYRILSPFEGNETSWIVVNEDASEAVAGYYQMLNPVNGSWLKVKLIGLNPERLYKVFYDDFTYEMYGSEIMQIGIPVDRKYLTAKAGDFASILIHLS